MYLFVPCSFSRANWVVCELVDGVPTHGVFHSSTLASLLPQGVVVTMVKMLTEKGRDHCLILTIWSHFVTILGKVSSVLCSVTPCRYNSSVAPNFKSVVGMKLHIRSSIDFTWTRFLHLRCEGEQLSLIVSIKRCRSVLKSMVFVNLYLFQRAKVDSTGSIHVQDIPYSGFILWEKIFVNGRHLCVLRIKFSRIAIISATPPESEQASASGRGTRLQYS